MTVQILERAQVIARPVDEVFPFFARASNLETITPSWLHFRLVGPEPAEMGVGTRFEYVVEPQPDGTLSRDRVRYALPLGPLREVAHRLLIRGDLERIFDYRHQAVARLLGRARGRRLSAPRRPAVSPRIHEARSKRQASAARRK